MRQPTAGTSTVLIANPGADLYGSDRMVLETVAALAGAGYRVILTVPGPGPLIEAAQTFGAEVVQAPTPIIRKSAMRPRGLVTLLATTARAVLPGIQLLRRTRPALVIVNTITPPLWFPLARLLRIPVVCHVHEGEASASRLVRIGLATPLRMADRLIVNSTFSLAVITDVLPSLRHRAVVIYNAVAGPTTVQPARPTPEAPIRLLYVGRLSARKGPDVAIRSMAVLRDRGVEATLTLVGAVFPGYEWFQQQLVDEIAEAGLADRVTFAGFQDDRWPATEAADIVLVPSTVDEPFGNVAVEAGLAARPQVVSDMSGLREAASAIRSAVRVPPSDPDAIADAVEEIVTNWQQFRRWACEDAETLPERYSRQRYAEEVSRVVSGTLRVRDPQLSAP